MSEAANLVYQETTTTGTGNITLVAKTGFRAFSDAFSVSDPLWYCIRDQTTGAFEVGVGHLSSASVLVRDTVIESSNANALVSFAAGTKDVISDVPASIQNTITLKAPLASPTFSGIVTLPTVKAASSAGVLIESNSGTDVALMGAGGGAGATFYGGVNVAGTLHLTATGSVLQMNTDTGYSTYIYGAFFPTGDQYITYPDASGELAIVSPSGPYTDKIAAFDSNKFLTPLSTSTYPSLTELAYVKGVTSGIQTQLNAKASTTQTMGVGSSIIGALADQDYTVAIKLPFAGTITSTTTKCATGTATATFKINTTALGGTANSVSTSEQSQAHASSNTFSAGDDIIITISSNAACEDMNFMIEYTRTLA